MINTIVLDVTIPSDSCGRVHASDAVAIEDTEDERIGMKLEGISRRGGI